MVHKMLVVEGSWVEFCAVERRCLNARKRGIVFEDICCRFSLAGPTHQHAEFLRAAQDMEMMIVSAAGHLPTAQRATSSRNAQCNLPFGLLSLHYCNAFASLLRCRCHAESLIISAARCCWPQTPRAVPEIKEKYDQSNKFYTLNLYHII